MTKKEAQEFAEEIVKGYMNLGNLIDACRVRGIEVYRKREEMESELVAVIVDDYCKSRGI